MSWGGSAFHGDPGIGTVGMYRVCYRPPPRVDSARGDLLVQGADENLPPNLTISLRDHRRSIAIFRGDQEVMRFVSPRTLGRTQ